jgi:hypothetical protein
VAKPEPAARLHVDDLVCVLNVVQQADLGYILSLTPFARRVDVALAFCGLTGAEWAKLAGLEAPTVWRWQHKEFRISWGGAFRLAKIMGQDAELLFADYVD